MASVDALVDALTVLHERLCILMTNYGDDSLAALQWILESGAFDEHYQYDRTKFKVVYIETGAAAPVSSEWSSRAEESRRYIEKAGIEVVHLVAPISFDEAILGRGAFPTPKFQWCATVLKAMPLLDWLDSIDPHCAAVILSAKRRETLLSSTHILSEWIEKSEHFNDRALWHPIIDLNLQERNALLKRAGLKPLNQPSLECFPCINSDFPTLKSLSSRVINRIKRLESTVNMPMFPNKSIEIVVKEAHPLVTNDPNYLKNFYRGCGNPFSCGI